MPMAPESEGTVDRRKAREGRAAPGGGGGSGGGCVRCSALRALTGIKASGIQPPLIVVLLHFTSDELLVAED